MRLLLGSGGFSTVERKNGWIKEVKSFLGTVKNVLFIPYALKDYDRYTQVIEQIGFHGAAKTIGIHTAKDPLQAIHDAEVISVGGGNTFRLINMMYQQSLIPAIRERVLKGTPFIGVSAGTNVACPTMKTTNDMPIVYPPSFEATGLIPFQINPHYFSGATHIKTETGYVQYGGETRDDRIREFHEMNSTPVIGLWEGSILRIEQGRYDLTGHEARARLFRQGEPSKDFLGPCDMTNYLPSMRMS